MLLKNDSSGAWGGIKLLNTHTHTPNYDLHRVPSILKGMYLFLIWNVHIFTSFACSMLHDVVFLPSWDSLNNATTIIGAKVQCIRNSWINNCLLQKKRDIAELKIEKHKYTKIYCTFWEEKCILQKISRTDTYHYHFNRDRHWKLFLKSGIELFYKHHHNDSQYSSNQVRQVGFPNVFKYIPNSLITNHKWEKKIQL